MLNILIAIAFMTFLAAVAWWAYWQFANSPPAPEPRSYDGIAGGSPPPVNDLKYDDIPLQSPISTDPRRELFESLLKADEAAAVAALLPRLQSATDVKPGTVLLVTSAFHMPRAQRLFEQAGMEVRPYPVDFKASYDQPFEAIALLPNAGAWHRTETAWRELLGRAYYTARSFFLSNIPFKSKN